MLIMFMTSILIMLLTTMLMFLALFLPPKYTNNKEKLTPFECGFSPMNHMRTPFSLHFFFIAIIFLIFDVEIALLLPFNIITEMSTPTQWMIMSTTFISILLGGLILEWKVGALKWTN